MIEPKNRFDRGLEAQSCIDCQEHARLAAPAQPINISREITRIDQIPDEELAEIASRGFTALWLVGVWQRSPASRKIKHLYGREERHRVGLLDL